MKILATGTAALLLTGCAHWFGPSDGLMFVAGATPSGSACTLSLAPVGVASAEERVVAGIFRERFVVHHSRRGHLAQLNCGGTVAASRTFKYGRDVRFGGELPFVGAAP
jgi:hypothetical protein